MGYTPKKTRTSWEDKFRRPSVDELLNDMNKQFSGLIETAREKIISYPAVVEELSWQGLPWRWALTYRYGAESDRAWAFLVPDPTQPRMSLPLSAEMVEALPLHRMKKHVKDAVLHGRLVDGVYWATWDVSSKTQLADIMELVQARHKIVTQRI